MFGVFGAASARAETPRDPDLAKYVARAVSHNRELGARSAELDAKTEAIVEARAGYLPNITLDARYTKQWGALDLGELINPAYATLNQVIGEQRFPTDLSLMLPLAIDAKVRVAQPLYVPALGPANRLAKLAAEAERTKTQIAQREIVAAVSQTYYAYARAAHIAELLRQTRPLLEENLAVSTALVGASKATEDVVLRARAELAAHDQRLRVVEQGQRAAARALAVLVALPVDSALPAPRSLEVPEVPAAAAPLIARARRARGEVALLEVAARATTEQRALARSAYLPTVSVALDLGFQRPSLGFDTDDGYAALSVVGSWNVYAGGRNRSRMRQREHELRANQLRQDELGAQLAAEVTSAWDAATVARAAVTAADERVASTEAAHAILSRRYAANDVPQLEVLVAQNALIAARTDRIIAVTDLYARLVELDRVVASDALTPEVSP
ncbi:MAG: TolC family protein [Kofleriaceae bacterium]|nr:TolC family protein [Kofleriaceae bacterium]